MASTVVQKINIKHSGNIIIDTVPPSGTVVINNGNGYAKSKKVSLSLNASDAATGIKDIEVRNIDILFDSNGNETNKTYDFMPLEYEENLLWNLNDEEGFKKVEVKFRDYANNISMFTSNNSIRKFFSIDTEEINGIVRIGDDVYSSTIDDGKIYIARHYPKIINDFDGENIKLIINNNNTLFVLTNLSATSKVYSYLDGEFVALNTFDSLLIDAASYDGELYFILENGELYKKDSSAWMKITTFSRDVLYIDGKEDFLYIIFNDSTDTIQIYNGTSFQTIDVSDLFSEVESEGSSSSSESSSSSSSTREQSSSTQTESTSSSSERSRSTSSVTVSELSSSTQIMTSSSSSSSSESSSTIEESSKLSSPSSESYSSDSFMGQFSESSESTPANSSSESSSQTSGSSSSNSSESSNSSGDICDCARFVDNSLYIDQIEFSNLKDIHTYSCNLFGRLVNLGGGLLRVLFYKDVDRSRENEIARSEDFYQGVVGTTIYIVESNGTGINGNFKYVSLFAGSSPSNFVVLCEGVNTSSVSSLSSSSTSSDQTSSVSQDVMHGTGTSDDPFLIRTPEEMAFVNTNPNAYFRLANDIDMSSIDSSIMDEYIPIGSELVPFMGYFDGYGHIITGFNIDRSGDDNIGLFGFTNSATIRRLGMHYPYVTGKNSVGSIVGKALNTTIDQCYVYGGDITGEQSVGGLIGYVDTQSDIVNSYSRNSSLSAITSVGGLVGFRSLSSSIIYNYSTSNNTSSSSAKGGLIGESGSSGDDEGEIVSCFWDIESTGLSSSDGGTGKTTSAMKQQGTFVGWSFDIIWDIRSNVNDGYPYLRLFSTIETDESSSSSTDTPDNSTVSSSSTLYERNWNDSSTSESSLGVLKW